MHHSKMHSLFNHLIGKPSTIPGLWAPSALGGLEVDYQLDNARLQDRQTGWLSTVKAFAIWCYRNSLDRARLC